MDGEEQIGSLAICDRRALFERNEFIGPAREHDLEAGHLFEQRLQAQRDIQHELGLGDAVGRGAWIVAAVTRIDDDLGDAQAQLTRQRVISLTRARR